jgi:hypothetical protein
MGLLLMVIHLTDDATGHTATDGVDLQQEGTLFQIINREAGDIRFGTSNVERMRIDASGNVGIGVTPEAWTAFNPVLRIKNASTGGGGALAGSGVDNFRMFANTYYDGAYKRLDTGFATQYGQESGQHVWSYAASGAGDSTITWSEAMRIDASGSVGIGSSGALTSTYLSKAFVYTAGGANFAIGGLSDTNDAVLSRFTSYNVANSNSGNQDSGNFYGVTSIESIVVTTDSNAGDDSGGSLLFKTKPEAGALAERMRIDASGNVGIGVVPSAWSVAVPALQLGICGAFLCAQGATEALYLGSNAYYNGTNWIYAVNAPATYYRENGGAHAWFNAPSGTTGDPITFTQAMTLDASGNLLVGDTSTVPFDGTSGVLIGGGRTSLAFATTGHTHKMLYSVNTGTAPGLHFYDSTNNRTDMIWDNSGNLLVGTTNTANLATHTPNVITDESFGINDGTNIAVIGLDRISFNAGNYYVLNESATGVKLVNGATSWTTQSDENSKENIVELSSALTAVNAMRCVRYNLKSQTPDDVKIGFIAQDWQSSYPEVVATDTDGTLGMNYTETIPVLLKAIQELSAQNAALTARIEALES